MAQVKMLLHVTGGRADGTQWPHAGGILDCDMREATELIAGGLAVAAERVRIHAEPPPAVPAGDEPQEPENGSEGVTDAQDDRYGLGGPSEYDEDPNSPAVRAAKAEWVEHAVNTGMDRQIAESMTKAQLMEQFRK